MPKAQSLVTISESGMYQIWGLRRRHNVFIPEISDEKKAEIKEIISQSLKDGREFLKSLE